MTDFFRSRHHDPMRLLVTLKNLKFYCVLNPRHYVEFSNKHSFNFKPPEELVNRIGYHLLRSSAIEDQQKALQFFKLNSENYPLSYNVFDSLGKAYLNLGKEKEAIVNFNKSLELNPNNKNAINMINRIKNTDGNQR